MQKILLFITILVLFQACDDEYEKKSPDLALTEERNITIQKNGDIRLERIEEILTAPYLPSYKHDYLAENGRYRLYLAGDRYRADLNDLRMGFHIFGKIGGAILSPCSSTKVYDNVDNTYDTSRERYEEFQPGILINPDPEYSNNRPTQAFIYFDIKKLRKLGYITDNQEDLCLFNEYIIYDESYGISYDDNGIKYYYKTNKLRYKAEEINQIVKRYEEMI